MAEPEPDESLLGFFHRLADVNGHPDGASLLRLVGWRYGRALVEALPSVEQSLGLAPGALLPFAPVARPPRGLLDGSAVPPWLAPCRLVAGGAAYRFVP